MSTFTLKSIARRGTMLVAAGALVVATFAPAAVFADALNPLTERSLLLSSSAPGWQDTDGSGYSEANPNPAAGGSTPNHYAPAGSGANGMKTGETFSFRISTAATSADPIKAFTLQYCQEAAGLCRAPGNNDTGKTNAESKAEKKSDLDVNYTAPVAGVDFKIYVGGAANEVPTEISDYSTWSMESTNVEDATHGDGVTGKRNMITLKSTAGITSAVANSKIRIVFLATETNHITNPGSGSFFVKMNTFSSDTSQIHPGNDSTPDDTADQTVIDGGVTVANVMADSIHITTKVLETMQFSVGTHNPDTDLRETTGAPDYAKHAPCEVIGTPNGNRLELGNMNAESSLETNKGYSVSSYWRLSSNSSGGATVYYSGETLTNTVGDIIAPMPATKTTSLPGSEQFGIAFQSGDTPSASFQAGIDLGGQTPYRLANLFVLQKNDNYAHGDGSLGVIGGDDPETATAQFAFDRASLKNPVSIADNLGVGGVLTCETAKMRYVGNIAADTPAGVYTTKVNYLAAPQY